MINVIVVIVILFLLVSVIGLFVVIGFRNIKSVQKKREIALYKGEYSRALLYSGKAESLFFILVELGFCDKSEILAFFFFKWIKERVISVQFLAGASERVVFILKGRPNRMGVGESLFFDIVFLATGEDKVLGIKEFKAWAWSNHGVLVELFNTIERDSIQSLENAGYIIEGKKGRLLAPYRLTDKGKSLEKNIITFRNYLADLSLHSENRSFEMFEYMEWALLLGMTEGAESELKKQYPNEGALEDVLAYMMYARGFSKVFFPSYKATKKLFSKSGVEYWEALP